MTLKTNNIQLGTNPTDTTKNIVIANDQTSGDLVFSKGTVDGTQTEIARFYNAGGNTTSVNVKQFGAVGDGVIDDSTALQNAAAVAKTLEVDSTVLANATTVSALADVTFRGNGSLTGPYHKSVVPDSSTSDYFASVDLVAPKHLKQLNTPSNPVVVLIGDSISTYMANSVARSDMLAEVLRTTLENQIGPITFYNRAIGGTQLSGLFSTQYAATIPWYVGSPAVLWLDMAKNLAPDLIVLSFGMNDSSNISIFYLKSVIDAIQAWPKVPSIVFATNLVPNPQSTTFPEGQTGQEGRDKAAGLIRTYAKFRGVGLIDAHRKHCMVRDGFDPVSSVMAKGDTVNAVVGATNSITGTRKIIDFKARISFDADALLVGGRYFTIKTGSGSSDFIQVFRPTSSTLRFDQYAGGIDSTAIGSQTITYTLAAGVAFHFVVERSNDQVVFYVDTDSQLGAFNAPLITLKVVALGSEYFPSLLDSGGNIIRSVDFSYADQKINLPSIKNSVLWGNETPSNIDTHGGSGWNHPSGYMASLVYRPLINAVNWVVLPTSSKLVVTDGTTMGYGTGSGGTQTQLTNKATAVTLNAPSGRIVMNNAALAGGASVSFVLNNSAISANSVIVFSPTFASGGYNYRVKSSVVSGSAYITVTNETGGSLSEAVVLNFATFSIALV